MSTLEDSVVCLDLQDEAGTVEGDLAVLKPFCEGDLAVLAPLCEGDLAVPKPFCEGDLALPKAFCDVLPKCLFKDLQPPFVREHIFHWY